MKYVKTLSAFLVLLSVIGSYSQNKMVLSAALNGGVFFHGDNKIGPGGGIDLEGRTNKFSIYICNTYNFYSDEAGTKMIELIIGPRWYIGNMNTITGVVETGLGFYFIGTSKVKLGINLGAGLNYPVSKQIDLGLKAKYHLRAGGYGQVHGGLHLNMRYYFNK